MAAWMRPLSAPAGGGVAVCPHCWGVNPGAERLCGRCGADMTLLLQESGGLRRTPPVQSPAPVRASERLGPLTRALLLLFTALLAASWLTPLLGSARVLARIQRQSGRVGEGASGRTGPSTVADLPSARRQEASHGQAPEPASPHSPTHPLAPSDGRRSTRAPATATGRF